MPYLTINSGNEGSKTFKFKSDRITIGRDSTCDLTLSDSRIDLFQSVISFEDGTYILRNISNHLNTFLNHLPALEAELFHGDEISIGDALLLFETESSGDIVHSVSEMAEIVPAEELETTVGPTIPRDDSSLISAEKVSVKLGQALEALFLIGRIIHDIPDTEFLLQKLVELITEVTRASRACFLAFDESGELYPKAVCGREKKKDKILISQSIVNQVKENHSAILCTNAKTDSRFQGAASISLGKIRAAICVPVEWKDNLFGILYLDARGYTKDFISFDEDDLRLVKAIAGQAALALDHAKREKAILSENITLRRKEQKRFGMVAESPGMHKVMEMISRLAPTNSTVLIRGETGTGKEVVARAIHFNSARRNKQMVTINCAAFPETLLYSELFGHEKGSFTGATNRRIGKFEQAAGGTIFLDEIAELDPRSQAVLLRILEEKKLQRLGGNQNIDVDVRVITATNRDLDNAIIEGNFRKDLYYRLKVLELFIPSLRDRKEDIQPLINFYLDYFAREGLRKVNELEPEALKELCSYNWPGNVRELKNAMERILVLGSTPQITLDDVLFISGRVPPPALTDKDTSIQELEKEHILESLRQSGGNKKQAADQLGINRATLYRKLKSYGISKSDR
jgi:transcriptional regulator with GAF, ATPase, and Fis domain